jgi:hypothetical protein
VKHLTDKYKVVRITSWGPGYETISNHESLEDAEKEIGNLGRYAWRAGETVVIYRVSHQAVAVVTASVTLDKKPL